MNAGNQLTPRRNSYLYGCAYLSFIQVLSEANVWKKECGNCVQRFWRVLVWKVVMHGWWSRTRNLSSDTKPSEMDRSAKVHFICTDFCHGIVVKVYTLHFLDRWRPWSSPVFSWNGKDFMLWRTVRCLLCLPWGVEISWRSCTYASQWWLNRLAYWWWQNLM